MSSGAEVGRIMPFGAEVEAEQGPRRGGRPELILSAEVGWSTSFGAEVEVEQGLRRGGRPEYILRCGGGPEHGLWWCVVSAWPPSPTVTSGRAPVVAKVQREKERDIEEGEGKTGVTYDHYSSVTVHRLNILKLGRFPNTG